MICPRALEATAEALEHRRDGLRAFAGVFRNLVDAREGGWNADLPRFHVRQVVVRADEDLLARIEGARRRFGDTCARRCWRPERRPRPKGDDKP
jgi:hypothetical protein